MFSRSGGNVCRYSYSARQGCFSPGLPKITPSSCDLNNSTHWKVRNAQVIACPDRQKWCPLRLTIFVFTHLVPVIHWHPTPGTCNISSLKMFLLFFLGSWAKRVYYNFLVLGLPIDQKHDNIAHTTAPPVFKLFLHETKFLHIISVFFSPPSFRCFVAGDVKTKYPAHKD